MDFALKEVMGLVSPETPNVELLSQQALSLMAMVAVTADGESKEDELLRDIFKFCDLNIHNPLHWRVLLDAIVQTGFKSAGAPTEWDEADYFLLLQDIRELQRIDPTLKSHVAIARELRRHKNFKIKYAKLDHDYLRRHVSNARNSAINMFAKMRSDESFDDFLAQERTSQLGLPAGLAKSYLTEVKRRSLEELGLDYDPDEMIKILDDLIKRIKRGGNPT